MDRRNFIKLASVLPLASTLRQARVHAQTSDGAAAAVGNDSVFSEEWLLNQAEALVNQSFKPPALNLPSELANLDEQRYRAIRFKSELSVWKDDPSNFELQFFHTGFQYQFPVEINLIEGDRVRPFPYTTALFNYDQPLTQPPPDSKAGFSGMAVGAPINRQDVKDEFLIFHGASFFRALAAGQVFGITARAISINTAQPAGEEFPFFRAFWIKKPAPGDRQLTIYALLDGPSVVGAYKFRADPGRFTILDVECSIFPRKQLTHVGIATLHSMYFFGAADPTRLDDYRPNVHSSNGLQIWNAAGEWIWRPLTNPEQLQYSVFLDRTPKGFGLLQRKRAFSEYEDIDARFGDRPSLWVEPMDDWGDGAVDLIEVPSQDEIYDNVIAFWRPRSPLVEKARRNFRYILHWGWAPPVRSTLSYVLQTRVGIRGRNRSRFFIIDFVSGHSCNACNVSQFTADARSGDGEIKNTAVRHNPATGGQRVSFEFEPGREPQTDLRCHLKQNGQVISETWIYRWTN
jgi:glucans biosynthesis protein